MDLMKKLTLGPDARSTRGMFSRGKAIYGNVRHSSKSGPTVSKSAIMRRLKTNGRPQSR